MVAKEIFSNHEGGRNYEESSLLQVPYEEEEETLSLCDLPTYSDSSQWEDLFKEEGKRSSLSNDDDDFFEFFSEDFTSTTSSTHATSAKNIIFCGKLIPFKEPPQQHAHFESKTQTHQHSNIASNGGALLPWRPNSLDKAKPTSRTSVIKPCDAKGSKNNYLCDYASIGKVTLMRSTTKSRWYLFMFGMSRLSVSTEMELSDIRNRQSRRGPATMFPAPEHGGEVVKSKGRRRNMKGLLRILRSLDFGCLSCNFANDVVKAAFV